VLRATRMIIKRPLGDAAIPAETRSQALVRQLSTVGATAAKGQWASARPLGQNVDIGLVIVAASRLASVSRSRGTYCCPAVSSTRTTPSTELNRVLGRNLNTSGGLPHPMTRMQDGALAG